MASKKKQKVEVEQFVEIGPELKFTIRKMIRDAIRWQNSQVLFTCRECCFYNYTSLDEKAGDPARCELDASNQLIIGKRMPTQLPKCFICNPAATAFAGVLAIMYALGVDTIRKEHGWATVVGRLAARADKYGYITGITQKNLDKYGPEE